MATDQPCARRVTAGGAAEDTESRGRLSWTVRPYSRNKGLALPTTGYRADGQKNEAEARRGAFSGWAIRDPDSVLPDSLGGLLDGPVSHTRTWSDDGETPAGAITVSLSGERHWTLQREGCV